MAKLTLHELLDKALQSYRGYLSLRSENGPHRIILDCRENHYFAWAGSSGAKLIPEHGAKCSTPDDRGNIWSTPEAAVENLIERIAAATYEPVEEE